LSPVGRSYAGPREPDGVRYPLEKGHLMLGLIVSLIIIGLIAGAIARLLVPRKQHLSIMMTIVLGIVGRSSAASWAT